MLRSILGLVIFSIIGLYEARTQTPVPVILPPAPVFDSITVNGTANAFGCVFTYISGTTTPLTTYSDSTGLVQNSNPVILNAAGVANIWIQSGLSYNFTVKTSGGTNCLTGTTVYTVNGIAGSTSQVVTNVTFSGTPTFTGTAQYQLFKMTLTGNVTSSTLVMSAVTVPSIVSFELTQDATGGRTFVWPLNISGGTPLNPATNSVTAETFFWDGTTAFPLDTLVSKTLLTPTFVNGTGSSNNLAITVSIANGSTGTVANGVTVIDGAGKAIAPSAGASLQGIIGITISGAGTTGSATIQTNGLVSCAFDGATTAGDFVYKSFSVAGDCHDAGTVVNSGAPNAGQIIGTVLSTNGGAGIYQMLLYQQALLNIPFYAQNGTPQQVQKLVSFGGTLVAGTATVTLQNYAVFNTAAPVCWAFDTAANNAIKAVATSTSSITVTGTGTDTFTGICIGNA